MQCSAVQGRVGCREYLVEGERQRRVLIKMGQGPLGLVNSDGVGCLGRGVAGLGSTGFKHRKVSKKPPPPSLINIFFYPKIETFLDKCLFVRLC